MKNKKFLSYFIGVTLAVMLSSTIHIFSLNKSYKVNGYKLTNDYTYYGAMKDNQFNGSGILTTPDGTYQGSFKDGRFDGHGVYRGKDYSYVANFAHDGGNKDMAIKVDNGDIYKKVRGKWEKINNEN